MLHNTFHFLVYEVAISSRSPDFFSEEWFLETNISILLIHSYCPTSVVVVVVFSFTTSSLRDISYYQLLHFFTEMELFQHSHHWSMHFSSLFLWKFPGSRSLTQWYWNYFHYFPPWLIPFFPFPHHPNLPFWFCVGTRVNMAGLRRSIYLKNNLFRNHCLQSICSCGLWVILFALLLNPHVLFCSLFSCLDNVRDIPLYIINNLSNIIYVYVCVYIFLVYIDGYKYPSVSILYPFALI